MAQKKRPIKEKDLYPQISEWLSNTLKEHFKNADYIEVFDSHNDYLSNILSRFLQKMSRYRRLVPNDFIAWQIKVDIFGMVIVNDYFKMIVVEVKSHQLKLEDLAQLIGYVKVIKPEVALLISPMGLSKDLTDLLLAHKRFDILEYDDRHGKKRKIHILKWIIDKNDIDYGMIIPKDPLSDILSG